jgi:hypothetical protein
MKGMKPHPAWGGACGADAGSDRLPLAWAAVVVGV